MFYLFSFAQQTSIRVDVLRRKICLTNKNVDDVATWNVGYVVEKILYLSNL